MSITTEDKMKSYNTVQETVVNDREVDARALLSCASRLRAAIDDGGKDKKAYGDAIRHNQRLWTMFQVALCEPDNQLPQHLKAILFNLSRYVDRVSFRAVESFNPKLLDSLIDINRTIANGLRVQPPQQTQVVPATTSTTAPVPPPAESMSVMISA